MSKIKIVLIRSLGFTGTTWANLVIGTHPRGFVLGPPDRIWKMDLKDAGRACLVHEKKCDFWPEFLENYDRSESFMNQLADFSGKNCIVINNPSAAFVSEEIENHDYDLRVIKFVRDGRANTFSMMRHHPDRYNNFYDAVRGWYLPAIRRLEDRFPRGTENTLLLQYESLVLNWRDELERLSEFMDEPINENSLRYWEQEQHLTAANSGVVDTLRILQGLPGYNWKQSEFYQSVIENARTHKGIPVLDNAWEQALTPVDNAAYEYLASPEHTDLGYSPVNVSESARREFQKLYQPPEDREKAIRSAPPWNKMKKNSFFIICFRVAIYRIRRWLQIIFDI